MSETQLELDTSNLPKPDSIKVTVDNDGSTRLVIYLDSIRSARAWAAKLGIVLADNDPGCRYVLVQQESGVAQHGSLRVHVIGTESVPPDRQAARRVVQAAARASAAVVA